MEKIHKEGQKNYIYNTYRKGITIPSLLLKRTYPDINPYMTAFVAEQKVFDKLIPRNTSIIMKNGEETLYKMQNYCKYDSINISSIYFNKELRNTFPLIKINSWMRKKVFKDQRTVTAFGKIYDPVDLKLGSEGYEERLYHMNIILISYFLLTILTCIYIYLSFFNHHNNKSSLGIKEIHFQ